VLKTSVKNEREIKYDVYQQINQLKDEIGKRRCNG
jgi:hypothetical protein